MPLQLAMLRQSSATCSSYGLKLDGGYFTAGPQFSVKRRFSQAGRLSYPDEVGEPSISAHGARGDSGGGGEVEYMILRDGRTTAIDWAAKMESGRERGPSVL